MRWGGPAYPRALSDRKAALILRFMTCPLVLVSRKIARHRDAATESWGRSYHGRTGQRAWRPGTNGRNPRVCRAEGASISAWHGGGHARDSDHHHRRGDVMKTARFNKAQYLGVLPGTKPTVASGTLFVGDDGVGVETFGAPQRGGSGRGCRHRQWQSSCWWSAGQCRPSSVCPDRSVPGGRARWTNQWWAPLPRLL